MKERPILFSLPMVRAILDGRKTQTRRVVKHLNVRAGMPEPEYQSVLKCCPYGQFGDRLWVRETHTFGPRSPSMKKWSHTPDEARVIYGADDWWLSGPYGPHKPKMRPSIHMPRWASRILLEVGSVRIERLQEISDEDASAEGVFHHPYDGANREIFGALWDQINGPGSWASNPWVWVVEFRKISA